MKLRPSKHLLNLRKVEATLVGQRRYAEAEKVKAEADKLERTERTTSKKKADETLGRKLAVLEGKHGAEITMFENKVAATKRRQEQVRCEDIEALSLRYDNCLKDLESQHNVQRSRLQSYFAKRAIANGIASPIEVQGSNAAAVVLSLVREVPRAARQAGGVVPDDLLDRLASFADMVPEAIGTSIAARSPHHHSAGQQQQHSHLNHSDASEGTGKYPQSSPAAPGSPQQPQQQQYPQAQRDREHSQSQSPGHHQHHHHHQSLESRRTSGGASTDMTRFVQGSRPIYPSVPSPTQQQQQQQHQQQQQRTNGSPVAAATAPQAPTVGNGGAAGAVPVQQTSSGAVGTSFGGMAGAAAPRYSTSSGPTQQQQYYAPAPPMGAYPPASIMGGGGGGMYPPQQGMMRMGGMGGMGYGGGGGMGYHGGGAGGGFFPPQGQYY
jgi:hypothetical protein